jgi:hypothetical protein
MSMTKRFYEQLEMDLTLRNIDYDHSEYMNELQRAAEIRYEQQREEEYSAMVEDLSHGF